MDTIVNQIAFNFEKLISHTIILHNLTFLPFSLEFINHVHQPTHSNFITEEEALLKKYG